MDIVTFEFTLNISKIKYIDEPCEVINNYIFQIYNCCRYGFENKCSKSIIKAYEIAEEINFKLYHTHKLYDEILNIFFHYELSNSNIYNCDIIISYMNKNTDSYQRHILKYEVLDWWIDLSENIDLNDNIKYNRKDDIRYKEIMNNIYDLLDKRRNICNKTQKDKDMYQLIRDHIFYFKMGLYVNSFDKMVHKCIKWFMRTDIDKIVLHKYKSKLLQRIKYIKEDLNKYNYVYIGILFDNILNQNSDDKYIIKYQLLK
jgi:hypothetical protein